MGEEERVKKNYSKRRRTARIDVWRYIEKRRGGPKVKTGSKKGKMNRLREGSKFEVRRGRGRSA